MDAREADELAGLARRGDPQALARLYAEFAPALLSYAVRLTGDLAAAEDVIHETFLRLISRRGRFEAKGRFRQWLFVVAANEARTRQRRARRFQHLDEDGSGTVAMPAPEATVAAQEDDLAHRECLELIEQVLAQLPRGYAEAFHLRVREGFDYREIAAITGDPEGTLRSRVHHTVSRLRATLVAAGARGLSTQARKGTR